jgi:hypothetical protein
MAPQTGATGAVLPQEIGASFSSPVGIGGIAPIAAATPTPEVSLGQLRLPRTFVDQVATLILTRRDIEVLPGPIPRGRIVARVQYGVGTASDEILLDWNYGSSITVPAGIGKVTVYAQQRGPGEDPTIGSGMVDRFTLSAMLVAGSRQSVGAPTMTYGIDVPALGTVTIRIPSRSKWVMVNQIQPLLSDAIVALNSTSGACQYAMATEAALRTTGVVIPGISRFLTVASVAGQVGVQVVFLLDG